MTHRHGLKLRHEFQVDVMMLYSETALEESGDISEAQMASIITVAIAESNQAFANSEIDLSLRIAHVGKVWMIIKMMLFCAFRSQVPHTTVAKLDSRRKKYQYNGNDVVRTIPHSFREHFHRGRLHITTGYTSKR